MKQLCMSLSVPAAPSGSLPWSQLGVVQHSAGVQLGDAVSA